MQPFLALITPVSSSEPPTGGPPPRPWGPINYPDQGLPGPQPGQPPRPWGPINYPDQGLPGNQPYPDQGLPRPPLGIWGGGGVGNYPDAGFPGPQPGGPVRPTHPIYYPPIIWDPAYPSNPIANPGDPNHPEGGEEGRTPIIEWKTAWSPSTGWIVVGVPTIPHPVPSDEGTE
jgi:hypothetical protein